MHYPGLEQLRTCQVPDHRLSGVLGSLCNACSLQHAGLGAHSIAGSRIPLPREVIARSKLLNEDAMAPFRPQTQEMSMAFSGCTALLSLPHHSRRLQPTETAAPTSSGSCTAWPRSPTARGCCWMRTQSRPWCPCWRSLSWRWAAPACCSAWRPWREPPRCSRQASTRSATLVHSRPHSHASVPGLQGGGR